jgi:tetratricopeptide (TPR) repeat protein
MTMNTFATSISLVLALWAAPALSQHSRAELGVGQRRPWAQGVSKEDQAAASALFLEGNAQLENSLFLNAIALYEKALALWDHPTIHYNMALSLVNLNEPLRLHKHLMQALRYEGQPLDADKIDRMRDLKKLVERQLVRLRITCDVPGTSVRMNGEELFVAPGRHESWVLPARYTFAAVKEGYPLNERERTAAAGEELSLDYKLYTQEELTRYHRPGPAWRPWAVVGLGAALAGGGFLLHDKATDRYRSFDEGILRCSSANDNRGCLPPPELLDEQARGNTFQRAALGTFSAGGAALALGFTLVYFNRLQARTISPDEHEQSVTVVPVVGTEQGGVTATFRF